MTFQKCLSAVALSFLWCATIACGDAGEGEIALTVWGEEYIEESIPEDEFEDGFSVEYEEFLIVLGDVSVAGGSGEERELVEMRLYDLTDPGPHEVGSIAGLSEGRWSEFGYRTAPADEDTRRHSSTSDEAVEKMSEGNYNLYVSGNATSDGEVFHFEWGFSQDIHYENCVDVRGGQETEGIVVGDGTRETHQLTIHGDHLFYDDLASADALLRFAALAAADANTDGEITLEELDAVRLASLSEAAGSYGVGAYDIDELGNFVRAATQSVGHFNGEGHCALRVE